MAGNELVIADFLFRNMTKISLNHLGKLNEIGAPANTRSRYIPVKDLASLEKISTEDSHKKADIYINGHGVSLKQSGASFSFNRLQRAEALNVFSIINCNNPEECLSKIDKAVNNFHDGIVRGRSRPWTELFTNEDFKNLTKFLMMTGSPNNGLSNHPAEFILEAPSTNINIQNVAVYNFDEYFEKYKNNFRIALRRQWIGQSSDSEHGRALGIAAKKDNLPWVFESIKGSPRKSLKSGKIWRDEVGESERRTVYMLFIEKI